MSQPVQQGSHHSFTATHDIMLSISADRGEILSHREIRWLSQQLGAELTWGLSPTLISLASSPVEAGKHGPMGGVEGSRVMQTMYLLSVDWESSR